MANLIVIAVILLAVVLAARSIWKAKKNGGGCSGNCGSCGSCGCGSHKQGGAETPPEHQ